MEAGGAALRAKASVAEKRIAVVRAAIVLFNTLLYAFGLVPEGIAWLAWAVILVANAYGFLVIRFGEWFKEPVAAATWTAAADAVLIALWLSATGAAASPFFLLWGISLVATAYRFGARPTAIATVAYLVMDASLLAAWGALWPLTGDVLVRLGYIGFFGLLGGFMAGSALDTLRREQDLAEMSQALRRSEARMTAVLASAPSTIVQADLDGRIQFVNHLAEGYGEGDVVGRSLTAFVPDDQRHILVAAMDAVRSKGEVVAYEIQAGEAAHGRRWYQSHLGPVRDEGALVGMVLVTLDVTKQKETEERVRQAESDRAEVERLRREDQFRRDLLNSVAHELNTPLTPLKFQVASMARGAHAGERVDLLSRNIDRLARLVEDLLDVARLSSGQVSVSAMDHPFVDDVQTTVSTFAESAAERGITLQVDCAADLVVHADPLRVTQVLYNLVSNALKYSLDGGTVDITARVEGEHIVCSVADQGLGIDEDGLRKVFQPFEHINDVPEGETGHGLGLYLCREIVEAHGGTLEVYSQGRGKGSTFTFTMPRGEQGARS